MSEATKSIRKPGYTAMSITMRRRRFSEYGGLYSSKPGDFWAGKLKLSLFSVC